MGHATKEEHLIVHDSHFNVNIIDLPMDILFGKTPVMHRTSVIPRTLLTEFRFDDTIKEATDRVLKFPAVASKSFLITIGDRSVTGLVARDQFVGKWQVPVADVSVTSTSFNTIRGEAMAMGERTPLALLKNYKSSAGMALAESLLNLSSAFLEGYWDVDDNTSTEMTKCTGKGSTGI